MPDQETHQPPYEAVLLNITFDELDPLSDEITLRYNTAKQTFTQKISAASLHIYSDQQQAERDQYDPEKMLFIRYTRDTDEDSADILSRRLHMTMTNKRDVILYDDKGLLASLEKKLALHNASVLVFSVTQPRKVEQQPKTE